MTIAVAETGVGETLSRLANLERLSDVREEALAPLVHAFEAESMVAFRQRMDGPQHCMRPVAALNQTGDVLSHYLQNVSPFDPSMPYWRSVALNAQSVWRYSDVLRGTNAPLARRFDRFLSERANVSHMLMMSFNLGSSGNDSLLFAMHRAPGRSDFGASERQSAMNCAPLLRQIFRSLAGAEVEYHTSAIAHSVLQRTQDTLQALVDLDAKVVCGDSGAAEAIERMPASVRAALSRALEALRARILAEGLRAQSTDLGEFAGQSISALPVDQSAKQFVLTLKALEQDGERIFSVLTPRQMEVAELVAKGCRNWQVAQLLGISENTVVNHLAAIYDSLAIGGRMELALLWKSNNAAH